MGYFNSWRFHYHLGYLKGLMIKKHSHAYCAEAILKLDSWAYEREWQQNLNANNPNEVMSKHQLKEAMAWGAGARKATGITDLPYPPEYMGAEWE